MNAKNTETLVISENTQATTGRTEILTSSKPTVVELGTLGRLQAYGFNYFDGRRYKNDPC